MSNIDMFAIDKPLINDIVSISNVNPSLQILIYLSFFIFILFVGGGIVSSFEYESAAEGKLWKVGFVLSFMGRVYVSGVWICSIGISSNVGRCFLCVRYLHTLCLP